MLALQKALTERTILMLPHFSSAPLAGLHPWIHCSAHGWGLGEPTSNCLELVSTGPAPAQQLLGPSSHEDTS